MRHRCGIGIIVAAAALAGCGSGDEAGGISREEAEQLNEAAEMLDASPDSLVADDVMLGNGDTPIESEAATDAPAQ